MNGIIETTCAASLLGLAIVFTMQPAHGTEMVYPERCKANTMNMPGHMDGMAAKGPEMSSEMTDYQKSFSMGMRDMNTDMMSAMMQDDADVAYVCGMIAHHMGAISMAETELAKGDNEAAKIMARRVIDQQKAEIDEMKVWLEKGGK